MFGFANNRLRDGYKQTHADMQVINLHYKHDILASLEGSEEEQTKAFKQYIYACYMYGYQRGVENAYKYHVRVLFLLIFICVLVGLLK